MASPQSLQEARQTSGMLGRSIESVPEAIRSTVVESTHDYIKALREIGTADEEIQSYVMNGVESAKELHSVGMKSGQLKKHLEEENLKAIQEIANRRDQERLAQMQAEQQHQSMMMANQEIQNSLNRGQFG